MRIIPVIDLMRSVVVRGVGGRRDEYLPINSQLASEPTPTAIATAFRQLGYSTVYVADLDAILGADPALDLYAKILDCDLQLWVDAGLRDFRQARRIAGFRHGTKQISGVVAGLESIETPQLLSELLDTWGPERIIVSLDLKRGAPLTACSQWQQLSPLEIAATLIDLGVQRLIVLDLASVGEGQGAGTEALCREIRDMNAELELIAGGGVRHQEDLRSLAQAGCNAALVASALHDGRLP